MRNEVSRLISEVQQDPGGRLLGTAKWMGVSEAVDKFKYPIQNASRAIFFGEALDDLYTPLGYADDRHVCVVSGTRGGKGTGLIIPNLCLWPGSCVVIDPKGENATVTAERRGAGSEFAHGMGQAVYNLDPFSESVADPSLRARFNPLDAIDSNSDFAVDDASLIAAALVVRENKNDPFWEDAARDFIKGLILYVLTQPQFEGRRNLVSVRRLIREGDWIRVEKLKANGVARIASGFAILWQAMKNCTAFDGIVSGIGTQMLSVADKTRASVVGVARTSTDFIDSTPMQRVLEASDFDLASIKTDPKGVTIYLTLPRRYMQTHFRWLRMMIDLAVGEMERIKGPPAVQTKHGHPCPTLFLLDEFAGLKRMEVIEHAAAQAAGFGVKFFFVLQNLPQLKEVYNDAWETFLSNAGLKAFFQIDDDFTRDYLSRLLGDQEVVRTQRTGSTAVQQGVNSSDTVGGTTQNSKGYSGSTSYGPLGILATGSQSGSSRDSSYSEAKSHQKGVSSSETITSGWSESLHVRSLANPDEIGRWFSRMDEKSNPGYPGILLAIIPGEHPLPVRRVNYYEAPDFEGLFGPHPDHGPVKTLNERDIERSAQRQRQAIAVVELPGPIPDYRKKKGGALIGGWLATTIGGWLAAVLVLALCVIVGQKIANYNLPKQPTTSVAQQGIATTNAISSETGRQKIADPHALQLLADQAVETIRKVYFTSSNNTAGSVAMISPLYAQSVNYYKKQLSHEAVMADKQKYAQRWPTQSYEIAKISGNCEPADKPQACHVEGENRWTVSNAQSSRNGKASFSYDFSIVGNGQLSIVGEDGQVFERSPLASVPK